MSNSVASVLPEGQAGVLFAVTKDGDAVHPAVFSQSDSYVALLADYGQGHQGGHPPTVVGMPEPHHESDDTHRFAIDPFVERAHYLLDYGQDVVTRLLPTHTHVATHLLAQMTHLAASLCAMLEMNDCTQLPAFVMQLDSVLVPGELLLQEVAE
jgi:hypothetical protein